MSYTTCTCIQLINFLTHDQIKSEFHNLGLDSVLGKGGDSDAEEKRELIRARLIAIMEENNMITYEKVISGPNTSTIRASPCCLRSLNEAMNNILNRLDQLEAVHDICNGINEKVTDIHDVFLTVDDDEADTKDLGTENNSLSSLKSVSSPCQGTSSWSLPILPTQPHSPTLSPHGSPLSSLKLLGNCCISPLSTVSDQKNQGGVSSSNASQCTSISPILPEHSRMSPILPEQSHVLLRREGYVVSSWLPNNDSVSHEDTTCFPGNCYCGSNNNDNYNSSNKQLSRPIGDQSEQDNTLESLDVKSFAASTAEVKLSSIFRRGRREVLLKKKYFYPIRRRLKRFREKV